MTSRNSAKTAKEFTSLRITILTFDDWPTLIWPLERSAMFRPLLNGMSRNFRLRRMGEPWRSSQMRTGSPSFICSISSVGRNCRSRNFRSALSLILGGGKTQPSWLSISNHQVLRMTCIRLMLETGKVELWAKSVTNGVDTSKFSQPELIHWPTFDKRTLSGFLYRPASKFKGKRPVIIDIHGGPEEQYRPGFVYEDNYLLNELGVAKIYPNVRGSSGYGKTFLSLDNGVLRDDAVKDIGALLDWIKTQPDLDADRVLVEGASYGGYLALSTAYTYSDRIRGTISDSGISNLASFVEHTEGWRRDIQRAEFGDERDPKIRDFMERTAPVNNAQKIRKPLLIIQGQNDPRVPFGDAAKLVAATKDRIPVWYILAKDEGHGFAQQSNRDYRTYATILFVKEFLLK